MNKIVEILNNQPVDILEQWLRMSNNEIIIEDGKIKEVIKK